MEATLTGANDRAGFKGERAKVDAHHWMQAVDGDQNDKADEEECLTLLQYMQQMLGGAYGDVSAKSRGGGRRRARAERRGGTGR